jgi:hypothetical protein
MLKTITTKDFRKKDLGVHSNLDGTGATISRQIECWNQLRKITQNKKEPKNE